MSVCRKLPDGTIQKIAGHTILLDANASEIREGFFTIQGAANTSVSKVVTFTDPMPDTDYVVIYEYQSWGGYPVNTEPSPVTCVNKTTTGFTASMWCFAAMSQALTIKYTAWKPVKIEGYTALQNKVNNPDDTPTIDSMNLVTSDGVARAIENASAVWKGTRAEWNALPSTDKVKYDLAVLLDQTLVKAIDRTDGTETNVADLSGQFVGTHAEWEAESNKTQYKTAVLTDERTTVNEVLSTGALNEVADNAKIWRGTKAEWDAMSTAEKAEWDQAEIETIEAQGLNPFRTLSDPEALSIASGTDYTCPHDGFITFTEKTHDNVHVYINGIEWAVDGYSASTNELRANVVAPVCKGDTVKYTGSSVTVMARWYTTDINPGNPIDYPVVHRSQSLDWDNKVAISNAEVLAGWTATGDGYFFGAGMGAANWSNATINGVPMAYYIHSGTYDASFCVQVPVEKGDIIKFYGTSIDDGDCTFVPYKDYPDYSTTEHWTGRRWIDGKKIYSRVVELPSPVTIYSNWTNIPVGIANINEILTSHVRFSEGGPMTSAVALPIASSTNVRMAVYGIDHGNIDMVVLEYTKTTD